MLDDQVLSRITGTLVRGTERIATKDVLTILGIEQRETKRKKLSPSSSLKAPLAPVQPTELVELEPSEGSGEG